MEVTTREYLDLLADGTEVLLCIILLLVGAEAVDLVEKASEREVMSSTTARSTSILGALSNLADFLAALGIAMYIAFLSLSYSESGIIKIYASVEKQRLLMDKKGIESQ